MRWMAGVLLLVLGAGSGGCTLNDLIARVHSRDAGVGPEDAGPEDAGSEDAGPGPEDAGSEDAGPGPEDAGVDGGTATALEAYCARPGPVWILDPGQGDGGETCVGHLTARVFRQALCSINGIESSAPLTTQTVGGAEAGQASVWTGASFRVTTTVQLGGSLQVDSSEGVTTNGLLSVTGDLLVRGKLGYNASTLAGSVWVGGDAGVAGDVFLDSLTVGGFLTQPDGGLLSVRGKFPSEKIRYGDVSFTHECPTDFLEDIASLVGRHRTENYDSVIHLDPAALDGFTEDPRLLTLPCGRFYLSQIQGGAKNLQIHVTGRTTLFVGGDVTVGSLEVKVDPDAQLDLFVAGSLTTQRLVLDSSGKPSHLRVYLAQTEDLKVPVDHSLSAHLYMPHARLSSDAPLNLSGSLFVNQLSCTGLSLSFDPDILRVGSTCSP